MLLNPLVIKKLVNIVNREKPWKRNMNQYLKKKPGDLDELPKGKQPIGYKWIYKPKFKADGSIDKYKSRRVAKGYL